VTDIAVRELPLFPLPEVVLFPQEILPLHIFESRYRIMLKSVLETDSRFGVVRWNPNSKKFSNVGCCAQIIQHQTSDDGRSNVVTIGQQRFRVLETIREAPFVTAMVTWIDDEPIDNPDQLTEISEKVLGALKDVVSLTGKLTESNRSLPDGLPEIPRELSFWIASHLGGPVADEQQNLLEILDTKNRLEREFEMLDYTRKQLAARTALKDSFANTDQANI
tara:strand:+ start:704 stop:1366 length:663 start_codon:yes stop_codon:yes gene_type:complete